MNILKKIIKLIRNPEIIKRRLADKNIIKMPDEEYIKLLYKIKFGKEPNLKEPKTFNEKIQWLKLYDRKDIYTKLADKYAVREYVEEAIGEEYLIPLFGVYDKWEEIDFNILPNKFVIKCTHDSGGVYLCKDKETFNIKKAKRFINKKLKRKYYYIGREWSYKNIKPRIVIEKYMENEDKSELKDYKFLCFNGVVKCSFVCSNRYSAGLNVDFFDLEWNKMPFERHYPNSEKIIEKPNNYKKMIDLAEKLSKGFIFVRIDFYEINNKIYFGEFTFYPGNGLEEFTPEEYDEILGDWIDISKNNL